MVVAADVAVAAAAAAQRVDVYVLALMRPHEPVLSACLFQHYNREPSFFGHAVGHQDSVGDSFTLIVQYFTLLVVWLNKLLDDL